MRRGSTCAVGCLATTPGAVCAGAGAAQAQGLLRAGGGTTHEHKAHEHAGMGPRARGSQPPIRVLRPLGYPRNTTIDGLGALTIFSRTLVEMSGVKPMLAVVKALAAPGRVMLH